MRCHPPAFVLLLTAALPLLAGCGSSPKARSGDMKFRVDPARLGAAYSDPSRSLSISPPLRWEAIPSATIEEAMRRVRDTSGTDTGAAPMVFAVYREPGEGASFVVSGFAREFSDAARDSLARAHMASLTARFPSDQVQEGRFTYRGFDVIQFRVVGAQQVLFKLLVSRPRNPLLQLDYLVPRGIYPRELESIESSIGSLRPLS